MARRVSGSPAASFGREYGMSDTHPPLYHGNDPPPAALDANEAALHDRPNAEQRSMINHLLHANEAARANEAAALCTLRLPTKRTPTKQRLPTVENEIGGERLSPPISFSTPVRLAAGAAPDQFSTTDHADPDVLDPPTTFSATDAMIFWLNNRPYWIHRLLGKGGFGEVYEVEMLIPQGLEVDWDCNGDLSFYQDGCVGGVVLKKKLCGTGGSRASASKGTACCSQRGQHSVNGGSGSSGTRGAVLPPIPLLGGPAAWSTTPLSSSRTGFTLRHMTHDSPGGASHDVFESGGPHDGGPHDGGPGGPHDGGPHDGGPYDGAPHSYSPNINGPELIAPPPSCAPLEQPLIAPPPSCAPLEQPRISDSTVLTLSGVCSPLEQPLISDSTVLTLSGVLFALKVQSARSRAQLDLLLREVAALSSLQDIAGGIVQLKDWTISYKGLHLIILMELGCCDLAEFFRRSSCAGGQYDHVPPEAGRGRTAPRCRSSRGGSMTMSQSLGGEALGGAVGPLGGEGGRSSLSTKKSWRAPTLDPAVATASGGPGWGGLSVGQMGALFKTLVDRVALLHERGMIHRDLKPQNFILVPTKGFAAVEVMARALRSGAEWTVRLVASDTDRAGRAGVTSKAEGTSSLQNSAREEGDVELLLTQPETGKQQTLLLSIKITDFGIARTLENDVSHLSIQGPSGTLVYMAPEAVRQTVSGCRHVGKKVDTWALGVMFYQILHAGETPFGRFLTKWGVQEAVLAVASETVNREAMDVFGGAAMWEAEKARLLSPTTIGRVPKSTTAEGGDPTPITADTVQALVSVWVRLQFLVHACKACMAFDPKNRPDVGELSLQLDLFLESGFQIPDADLLQAAFDIDAARGRGGDCGPAIDRVIKRLGETVVEKIATTKRGGLVFPEFCRAPFSEQDQLRPSLRYPVSALDIFSEEHDPSLRPSERVLRTNKARRCRQLLAMVLAAIFAGGLCVCLGVGIAGHARGGSGGGTSDHSGGGPEETDVSSPGEHSSPTVGPMVGFHPSATAPLVPIFPVDAAAAPASRPPVSAPLLKPGPSGAGVTPPGQAASSSSPSSPLFLSSTPIPPEKKITTDSPRDAVLEAVRADGRQLKYASVSMQWDEEIVKAAVENYGLALCDTPRVRAGKEQKGQYVTFSPRYDPDIVVLALKKDADALKCVDHRLLSSRKIMEAVVTSEKRSENAEARLFSRTHEPGKVSSRGNYVSGAGNGWVAAGWTLVGAVWIPPRSWVAAGWTSTTLDGGVWTPPRSWVVADWCTNDGKISWVEAGWTLVGAVWTPPQSWVAAGWTLEVTAGWTLGGMWIPPPSKAEDPPSSRDNQRENYVNERK